MVDDVKEITETAENKASAEALARARLVRERRETEQRKRLDELRAHAAAAQAQREKRDEERRKRQAEQRARDDDRRQQVEERKRAIWEASVSRREALLQRERDRTERLERSRAAHSSPRPCFAFGSSTPRLLEPLDSAGFFWAARRAASTTNVMFASAPLTRRTSALQLDSEIDNKDEPERSQQPAMWSSVARRRTDLVPTLPTSRSPGRAHSMTRLDKLPSQRPLHSASPSMHHLNRAPTRSGDTTPGSRPGSAMTNMTTTSVVRRVQSAPRKPRPASIAGTGVNTPRGLTLNLVDGKPPLHRKPKPSKDHHKNAALGTDKMQVSAIEVTHKLEALKIQNGEKQPYPHNQNIDDKENEDKLNVVPTIEPNTEQNEVADHNKIEGRTTELQKSIEVQQPIDVQKPTGKKEKSIEGQQLIDVQKPPIKKEKPVLVQPPADVLKSSRKKEKAIEVTQHIDVQRSAEKREKSSESQQLIDVQKLTEKKEKINEVQQPIDVQKSAEKKEKSVEIQQQADVLKPAEKKDDKKQEKKDNSQDKADESDMTASMISRRITSEEEAKAALAERRRRAREELERHAELERQRLQREAEEELERQRLEEEKQRREEEEAKELAKLQRQMEEEKLRKAIETQQQLERDEVERKAREEVERQARIKEEEEKRKAAEETERLRKEEAEREEKERLARKQRVEAIMARTRLRKAEEDKKQHDNKGQPNQTQQAVSTPTSTGPIAPIESSKVESANVVATGDLLDFGTSQVLETKDPQETIAPQTNNTVSATAGDLLLLGLSEKNNIEQPQGQVTATINNQHVTDNSPNANNVPTLETNNGNIQLVMEPTTNVGHLSANFIQTEILSAELSQTKLAENILKQTEDDLTAHNGNGTTHNHPLTLQNAI